MDGCFSALQSKRALTTTTTTTITSSISMASVSSLSTPATATTRRTTFFKRREEKRRRLFTLFVRTAGSWSARRGCNSPTRRITSRKDRGRSKGGVRDGDRAVREGADERRVRDETGPDETGGTVARGRNRARIITSRRATRRWGVGFGVCLFGADVSKRIRERTTVRFRESRARFSTAGNGQRSGRVEERREMEDYFNEISSERKRDCVPVRPVELVDRESDRNDVEEKQE